ncbi:hypothetical protein SAMN05443544_2608 [Agromyces cerinus subsp. cerinus]|uniref:Uncharacterized protein n=1 Tax=Agromyces cerinus subsp. cerinus TaxID=232089 RepID=A0A1N6GIJ7_9MICO|nr:hypothetical protein SAMN05443544_2608 [Agromyces cerinus subsp. cerinus]
MGVTRRVPLQWADNTKPVRSDGWWSAWANGWGLRPTWSA